MVGFAADNQIPVCEAVEKLEIGKSLGYVWSEDFVSGVNAEIVNNFVGDLEAVIRMKKSCTEQFDGQGKNRVLDFLEDYYSRVKVQSPE